MSDALGRLLRGGLVGVVGSAGIKRGAVGTFGAEKYTKGGWLDVPDGVERYTDALYRHLLAEGRGELVDHESGLLHAAHSAWNALARLDLMLREAKQDD